VKIKPIRQHLGNGHENQQIETFASLAVKNALGCGFLHQLSRNTILFDEKLPLDA
jgi:hypothetical protein